MLMVRFISMLCLAQVRKLLKKELEAEKTWVLTESHHFSGHSINDFNEMFEVEQTEHRYFINDPSDDYYEEIKIDEYEIITN